MFAAALAAAALFVGGPLTTDANAQSIVPMRGKVKTFSETFQFRVFPGNPYARPMKMDVRVYDRHFRPVPALVVPPTAIVGAGRRRPFRVIVPFNGRGQRKVRICAEATPDAQSATAIRAQVCGRFLAIQMR